MTEEPGSEAVTSGRVSGADSGSVADPSSAPSRAAAGGLTHAPHRRSSGGSRLGRAMFRLQERAVVIGYRLIAWLMGVTPLGISLPIAGGLMRLSWWVWPAKRRVILANASHILGRPTDDPAVRRLAGRVYQTYGRYIVELMRLPSRAADEPARMVDSTGERGVDAFADLWAGLQSEGRGIIALSIHIGSIETLIAAFAARGFPTYGLADDSAYPELYALLQAQRKRWGVDVFPWRQLRRVYSVLRQPALLGLLVDWGYRADGIPVRLFGDWTTLPAGPAVLAAKTNAVIVPIVCRRLASGRFAAEWLDPIEVHDDDPASIAAATQAVAHALEAMVRPAPEQWYTFKPIWPGGADEAATLAARAEQLAPAASDRDRTAGDDQTAGGTDPSGGWA